MGGKCQERNNVYQCTGLDDKGVKIWSYYGLTEGNMKYRVGNHLQSFRQDRPKREKETSLSEQVWKDRREGIVRKLHWEKVAKAKARGPNNKRCNLCDTETLFILNRPKLSVNTRLELGAYCPHKRKHILANIKSNKETKTEEKCLREANKARYKQNFF